MQFDDMDALLSESMEVADNGFTDKLLQCLPPEKKLFIQTSQLWLWGTTLIVVGVIIALASLNASISSPLNGSWLAVLLVSLAIFWIHFEEVLA